MLYFFNQQFMKIRWHDMTPNRNFMLELFDKIKNYEFIQIANYVIEKIDVQRIYFQDGSFKNEVEFEFRLSFDTMTNLVGNTGGEGKKFGNVILTKNNRTLLFSDLVIISTRVHHSNEGDYLLLKTRPNDCVELNVKYSNFIAYFLKHKKIDTSYFPYDNDKDFFLL